ncbi:Crp/Fnr family transcriptional regulator [Flavobacterium sp. CAU 1735]|uniref:Crp/Fnr family transcriptional regulator n=1 Tax=Flavobacterium sp. CAU 1735 TaxID=3140361 RepID=UPI003261195B
MTAALPNLKNYLQSKAGITEEQFEALTQNLKTATIEKGGILLKQGEICHHSFFVEQGLLRSYTIDDSGKEHIIQFATENWIISDRSSIFFNEPSDFFIDAVEPTTFVYLDQQFIHRASEMSAAFRIFNEKALQNHIRHLQKRINLLLAATAEQRYLDFIKLYPDVTLRVPQWMIASYLGITPESLSRVRKELAKRNFKPY